MEKTQRDRLTFQAMFLAMYLTGVSPEKNADVLSREFPDTPESLVHQWMRQISIHFKCPN